MNPLVAAAVRVVILRSAKTLAWILVGIFAIGMGGACSAQHTVLIEEIQPGGRANLTGSGAVAIGPGGIVLDDSPGSLAIVSDSDRYRLAINAGFSEAEAIVATAISIAENGSGDPTKLSARNQNGSYDLGLWQINSVHWPQFGGQGALMIPQNNAKAARAIYLSSGWCAWFTYETSCGPGHTGSYRAFLEQARRAALPQSWHDLPAFNQYDRNNWGNPQNFATWRAAACSPAALRWMLTAYGHPLSSIDEALSLIGPYTAITPAQGLSDHTGPGLVAALGRAGFHGWNEHLTSTNDLRQRIARGPLMLDGQRWFGVGHWFVAMGSDNNGISIRESSGSNITYLTWDRLYGEVGWSGWVVGVQSVPPSNQA